MATLRARSPSLNAQPFTGITIQPPLTVNTSEVFAPLVELPGLIVPPLTVNTSEVFAPTVTAEMAPQLTLGVPTTINVSDVFAPVITGGADLIILPRHFRVPVSFGGEETVADCNIRIERGEAYSIEVEAANPFGADISNLVARYSISRHPLGATLVEAEGAPYFYVTGNGDGIRIAGRLASSETAQLGLGYHYHEIALIGIDGSATRVMAGQVDVKPGHFANVQPSLKAILIDNADYNFGQAQGTLIGTISQKTAGSTIEIFPPDDRVQLIGNLLQVGPTGADSPLGTYAISFRETLANATNSPRTTTITITVEEVDPILSALNLSAATFQQGASVGSFIGLLSGMTIGSTLSIVGGDTRVQLAGSTLQVGPSGVSEVPGSFNVTVRETLSGASNTPRDSVFAITVTALPVTLAPLSLSASTYSEGDATGTMIGTIIGRSGGSSLTIEPADTRVQISGSTLQIGPTGDDQVPATFNVTIRETLAGATNTPRDSVVSITVLADPVVLNNLSLSNSDYDEGAATGTTIGNVIGRTPGSTLSITPSNTRVQLSGTVLQVGSSGDEQPDGTFDFTLRETLPGASNSPRDTVLTITVNPAQEGDAFFFADAPGSPWYAHASPPPHVHYSDVNLTVLARESWRPAIARREAHAMIYDHAASTWLPDVVLGVSGLTDDDHGVPAICRDASGYLYCFYGAHNSQLRVSGSSLPNNWATFREFSTITGTLSYPHPVLVGSDIWLFLRDSTNATRMTGVVCRRTAVSVAGTPTWSARTTILDFDADSRVYIANMVARGTDIHFLATRANAADTLRQNVYYFIWDTVTGAIKNLAGTFSTTSFPVTKAQCDANCRVIDQQTAGLGGGIPVLAFDTNDNPHILYKEGAVGSGDYDLYHTMYNGSSWSAGVKVGDFPTGNDNHRYDGMTIVRRASGAMDAYWVTQGTVTGRARNGAISTRQRAANGTWGSVIEVMDDTGTYGLGNPSTVQDANAAIRVVWAEDDPNTTAEKQLKGYAYGDGGLVYRPTAQPVWTPVNAALSSYIARRATAPSEEVKFRLDAIFSAIVAIGIGKFDAFYVATDNESDSMLNLLSPNFTLTKSGTVSFTPFRGWRSDGATGKLLTGITPSISTRVATLNSEHIACLCTSPAASTNSFAIGQDVSGPTGTFLIPSNGTQLVGRVNSAAGTTFGSNNTANTGYMVMNRSGSNSVQVTRGVQLAATTSLSSAFPTSEFTLLHNAGAFAAAGLRILAAHFGASLTQTEIAMLRGPLANYEFSSMTSTA